MRLEGVTDDCHDVWVYFLSDNVHQLGFGKKHHLRLNVPSGELRHQVLSKTVQQGRSFFIATQPSLLLL